MKTGRRRTAAAKPPEEGTPPGPLYEITASPSSPEENPGRSSPRMKSPSPGTKAATAAPRPPPGARPRPAAYPPALAHARADAPRAAPGTIRARTPAPVDNPIKYRRPHKRRSRSSYRSSTGPEPQPDRRIETSRSRSKAGPEESTSCEGMFCSSCHPRRSRPGGPTGAPARSRQDRRRPGPAPAAGPEALPLCL